VSREAAPADAGRLSSSRNSILGPIAPTTKMQNLYEITVNLEHRGEQKYTVTLTKNVCDETMLDIVPGIPAENK
jgi:hypothetical protein